MSRFDICVVGAGTMGRGIAHVFAVHGYPVHLVDDQADALDDALATIRRNLERQVRAGRAAPDVVESTIGRITVSSNLKAAASIADLVVEAVREDMAIKREVFRMLDAAAPGHAVLASNTSSLSVTALAAATTRPASVIGMHFFNPAHLMKLVEVVRGLQTSDETFERVLTLVREVGKEPVEARDFPGFVSNRVLMPMINEACYCVMEGVAPSEDVDRVMKLGMRHPMGPLELADFIGLDVCLSIMEALHGGLGDDKYRPCPLLRQMVAAGRLGRKSGRGFHEYGNP